MKKFIKMAKEKVYGKNITKSGKLKEKVNHKNGERIK